MGILGIVLLVVFVITSLLLVFMVVIQNESSEGLGGIFSGSSSSAFGSRSSNVMVRFTYALGGIFFVTAFALAIVNKGSVGDVEAAAREQGQTGTATEWWNAPAPAEAPAGDTSPGAQVANPAEAVPLPVEPKQ